MTYDDQLDEERTEAADRHAEHNQRIGIHSRPEPTNLQILNWIARRAGLPGWPTRPAAPRPQLPANDPDAINF